MSLDTRATAAEEWRSGWTMVMATFFGFSFLSLVNGYTQGTKLQINGYLTARYAGIRNFGKVYGLMNSVIALGSALGPVIAAFAYDMRGDYTLFLIAGTIGSVICGLIVLTLPRYPAWNANAAPSAEGPETA